MSDINRNNGYLDTPGTSTSSTVGNFVPSVNVPSLSPEPPTDDTLMHDDIDGDVADEALDPLDDNLSFSSGESAREHDSDYDSNDEPISMYEVNAHVQTSSHLGELVSLEFADPDEDGDDEERNMFDDGLEDDESTDSESEASTNYEELEESENPARVIRIRGTPEPVEASDQEGEDNDSDAWNPQSDSDDSMAEDEQDKGEGPAAFAEQILPLRQGSSATVAEASQSSPPRKTFAELEKQKYELFYQKSQAILATRDHPFDSLGRQDLNRPVISLADDADKIRWNILGLQEAKKRVEEELEEMEQSLKAAEEKQTSAENTFRANLEAEGISQELFDAYEAFCESLNMEFGHREGFSITCFEDHEKSYVKYDPDFVLFKETVEMSYNDCNFRCEATTIRWGNEPVVKFWPIKAPEPISGTETTWGEQYAELYNLAAAAVRDGSEAAMEMLIALPDMNSTFSGGWLFEYQYEDKLANELVVAKRWRFKSAHKIDSPVDVEEKKMGIELLLRSENVH